VPDRAGARLSEEPCRAVWLLETGADFPTEAKMVPLLTVSRAYLASLGVPEFARGPQDHDVAGRRGGRRIRLPGTGERFTDLMMGL